MEVRVRQRRKREEEEVEGTRNKCTVFINELCLFHSRFCFLPHVPSHLLLRKQRHPRARMDNPVDGQQMEDTCTLHAAQTAPPFCLRLYRPVFNCSKTSEEAQAA